MRAASPTAPFPPVLPPAATDLPRTRGFRYLSPGLSRAGIRNRRCVGDHSRPFMPIVAVRTGILGWSDNYPVVAKAAFTLLLQTRLESASVPNQRPPNGCGEAKLLAKFRQRRAEAQYSMADPTDMSKCPGAPVVPKRKAAPTVGTSPSQPWPEGDMAGSPAEPTKKCSARRPMPNGDAAGD